LSASLDEKTAGARPLRLPTLRAGSLGPIGARSEASEEVRAAMASLTREAAAARERARIEGFEAGRREGRAAAQAEYASRFQEVAAALQGAARTLLGARVQLAAEVEHQLPKLVFALARKIIHQELAEPHACLQAAIRGLTERLAGCDRPAVVRVAPVTLDALDEWRRSEDGAKVLGPTVRLEADPALGAGEWLLQTDDGFLDGRVESQLEEAWRLLGELPR